MWWNCHFSYQNFPVPIFQTYPRIAKYETFHWSKTIKILLLMRIERLTETFALNQTIPIRCWPSVAVLVDYTRRFILIPILITWWRHQMEIFSALLALYAGNSLVPGEFPAQRRVTPSFEVFCNQRLNKRLRKQSWGWWFETLSHPLWRQCNEVIATYFCTSHDSCAFVLCTKWCNDLMANNRKTWIGIFRIIGEWYGIL